MKKIWLSVALASSSLFLTACNDDHDDTSVVVIEDIGRKRGCLVSGGHIDFDKASEIVLRELRQGKLGPFSLDKP